MKHHSLLASCAVAAMLAVGGASAQQYPNKPVKVIIANPPGQSIDTITRLYTAKLASSLGQSFVIDNRGGAGGVIGTAAAAKSPPDGYTLFIGTAATHGMNLAMYENVGYDPERDFSPIGLLGRVVMVVAATPAMGIRSIPDLIAKSRAGKLDIAVPSSMATHVADLLKQRGKIDLNMVPYKGSAQAMTDVLGGHITLVVDTATLIGAQVATGKLVPLGVTSAQQTALMPGLKTVAEQGLPGFEVTGWYMVFAPMGTPRPILELLNGELRKIQADPEIQKQLLANGVGPTPVGELSELVGFVKGEHERWVKAIRASLPKAP